MDANFPPMKVLMASTSFPADAADWRGLFIRQMTFALARRRDLRLKTWCPPGQYPENIECAASPEDEAWLSDMLKAGGIAHAVRTGSLNAVLRPLQLLIRLHALYRREKEADVVHANWLQVALPIPKDQRPLLVTVLGTDFRLLRLPGMRRLLRRVFSARRTVICPNAEWMVPDLRAAFGDIAEIHCVPFGIDEAYYSLVRRPEKPEQWLCISRITTGKIGDLLVWGERYFKRNQRRLHLFGPMQESIHLPEWLSYHGPVSQSDLLAKWFPSATGLVSLSRHPEGRPQVMLEAMAAGLPIVASALPAHCSLLEPSGAGIVCKSQDEFGLALEEIEQPESGVRFSAAGRAFAMQNFGTWDTCAARYAAIYRRLLTV